MWYWYCLPVFLNLKARWLRYVPPCLKLKKFSVLAARVICVFCLDLRINSYYLRTQHWLITVTKIRCVYCAVRIQSKYSSGQALPFKTNMECRYGCTHSQPLEVIGQLRASVALPQIRIPGTHLVLRLGDHHNRSRRRTDVSIRNRTTVHQSLGP
jgi:hypothetical protein